MEDFRHANIIFIPESNLAFEGMHLERTLRKAGIKNACVMKEDDNRAGVKINGPFKKLMAWALNAKLGEKSMYVYEKFLVIAEESNRDKMISEVESQLLNYSRIIKPSNVAHKAPTEIYNGKSGYGYDDLVIALQLNLIMKNRFYTSTDYAKWR
jgi:hypothetical protein